MKSNPSLTINHKTEVPHPPFGPKNLISWYKKNARNLPWRHTSDPYKIWISEVMLQQTTVTAVIPYYEKWIKVFPTIEDVSEASLQKVLKTWQGLGYYTRVKNIHASAKLICEKYDGKIPSDSQILQKLPGFGPYTTGAVLSIAFHQRQSIIDANIRRLVMRLLAIKGFADTHQDNLILKFLDKIIPTHDVNLFNQALMELGALICRPKNPLCLICPVQKFCKSFKQKIQNKIPQSKKSLVRLINVVIAIIINDGKYFIQKRPPKGLFADLWEFPGGKIERGEKPESALKRELQEELNVHLTKCSYLMNVDQLYTQFRARLHVFACYVSPKPNPDKTHQWVSFNGFSKYPMPSGSVKIIKNLLKKQSLK